MDHRKVQYICWFQLIERYNLHQLDRYILPFLNMHRMCLLLFYQNYLKQRICKLLAFHFFQCQFEELQLNFCFELDLFLFVFWQMKDYYRICSIYLQEFLYILFCMDRLFWFLFFLHLWMQMCHYLGLLLLQPFL